MNNSFFSKFMPSETKFFPLLKELANVFLVASELLIDCLKSKTYDKEVEVYKQIKEQEKKGDVIYNKIFDELNSTFITPFDREDIQLLAEKIEDAIDNINSGGKRIILYRPKHLPESAMELANLIHESAICIGKAIAELDVLKKNSKKIQICCSELHDIENKGDDIYEHFIISLFENEKDSIEIVKLKEIMLEFERVTDTAEHVGKVIRTIIVKYA